MTRLLMPLALVAAATLVLGGVWPTPYDPTTTVGAPWQAPSSAHLLGTDVLGRDVWSRVLTGGGRLLTVAVAAALCASAIGIAGGLVAGWSGGLVARLLTACADLLLALPSLLLALVAAIALPWQLAVIVATVCGGAPLTLRVVRDAVHTIRSSGYVEAALLRGERPASILLREVFPAMRGLISADLGLRLVVAIQVCAALGVLGLGASPPAPDWALMLRENMTGVSANPWAVAAPAIALGATTVLFALVAQTSFHEHENRRPDRAAQEERPHA